MRLVINKYKINIFTKMNISGKKFKKIKNI